MKKQLSSIVTPFYKVVPFVVGIYFLFLAITEFNRFGIAAVLFLCLWCTIWYLGTHRWKSVYLEDDTLRVSNYIKRITIPVREIEQVRASSWWGRQPRTI